VQTKNHQPTEGPHHELTERDPDAKPAAAAVILPRFTGVPDSGDSGKAGEDQDTFGNDVNSASDREANRAGQGVGRGLNRESLGGFDRPVNWGNMIWHCKQRCIPPLAEQIKKLCCQVPGKMHLDATSSACCPGSEG